MQAVSRELENEGINWSNKKVMRVTDALKSLIVAYLAVFKPEEVEEATKSQLIEEITSRSCIQKGDTVEALAGAIDTEAREANSFSNLTSLMRLQKLSDF